MTCSMSGSGTSPRFVPFRGCLLLSLGQGKITVRIQQLLERAMKFPQSRVAGGNSLKVLVNFIF